ncbi:unnamed protein product [Hydatigera taeniaeformis]|uniref:Uncharacterized protein n=1 Tax=Hydatigena taeniaeformis TaxID=6205 RepID=A0A0R3X4Z4_HYDTA|nr:unnamed protein product [Hydatigera taeniaeformis]
MEDDCEETADSAYRKRSSRRKLPLARISLWRRSWKKLSQIKGHLASDGHIVVSCKKFGSHEGKRGCLSLSSPPCMQFAELSIPAGWISLADSSRKASIVVALKL